MAEAVVLAGGEVVHELAWGEPLAGAVGLLVLDASGEPVSDALIELAERADVVCCDLAQLDAVASVLLLSDTPILCQPSMAERVAALLVATRGEDAPAYVGETDGERLRRIGDDLARVTELLTRLVQREERADALADRTAGYSALPADPVTIRIDPAEIRRVIRARRVRDKAFRTRLFEDPAWDMLLDLYAAQLEEADVSVSSLCIAAAVAPTTALRWIGRMTAGGLLVRTQDAGDKRRALITLAPAALAGMERYVAMIRQQGLPFV
jgi:DNA-binding MarR family transcriptional regulator